MAKMTDEWLDFIISCSKIQISNTSNYILYERGIKMSGI